MTGVDIDIDLILFVKIQTLKNVCQISEMLRFARRHESKMNNLTKISFV